MKLLIVDTSKIQTYIFGSNRLRENIGASYLVDMATGEWAYEALPTPNNAQKVDQEWTLTQQEITDDLAAEVIYAGGGNFVVLFTNDSAAKKFTTTLSKRVLIDAPGLRLNVGQVDYHNGDSLSAKIKTVVGNLKTAKQSQANQSYPLLGQAVSIMCSSTGLPAKALTQEINGDPDSEYPASAEILAKRGASNEANRRLAQLIPIPRSAEFEYPSDFDNLGRSIGENSFIAVVHADGDGMGRRFIEFGEHFQHAGDNAAYKETMRGLSNALNAVGKQALRNVVGTLSSKITVAANGKSASYKHPYQTSRQAIQLQDASPGHFYLPFRPIVFGGDDVAFVCDGRLGLELANLYMRQFKQLAENMFPKVQNGVIVKTGGTSSAGVAIVKVHYPFSRAYSLAEGLAASAKTYRRKIGSAVSCLDWHFALSGLSGSLGSIRAREYEPTIANKPGRLYLRPVSVGANTLHEYRSWETVMLGLQAFQGNNLTGRETTSWADKRNKAKALRDALRAGKQAVQAFRVQYNGGEQLPQVTNVNDVDSGWRDTGWVQDEWSKNNETIEGMYCGYFDALELMDLYMPIEEM